MIVNFLKKICNWYKSGIVAAEFWIRLVVGLWKKFIIYH